MGKQEAGAVLSGGWGRQPYTAAYHGRDHIRAGVRPGGVLRGDLGHAVYTHDYIISRCNAQAHLSYNDYSNLRIL